MSDVTRRTTVEEIAGFATGRQALESPARERLKLSVLDTLGCAIGALGAGPVAAVRSVVEAFGGTGTCTVVGGPPSAPDRAAMMNGCLVRYLDFMDNYARPGEVCHPADNFAAVLAPAEHADRSGDEFLTALAVAYGVQARLLDLPTMRAGVNYTTPLAFSAAAGASRALGLDAERAAHALALAGVGAVSCAVIQAEPVSQWKGLSSGEAASRALHNTYLARAGITGTLGVFDGPFGIFHLVGDELHHDWSREPLDAPLETSIKKHNAEFQSQTAVDLAIDLRRGLGGAGIERVVLEVAEGAYNVIGGGTYGPKLECHIKEQADHNLEYLVAVALLDGEVWPSQFTGERINRAGVQDLLRKVEVKPNQGFSARIGGEMPVAMTIERAGGGEPLRGGKASYRGFHTDPMSWDEVRAKFDRLVDGKISPRLADEIAGAVAELERRPVRALTALLATVGGPR